MVNESNSDKSQRARRAVRRVVEAARRGQARLNAAYRQEAAALGTWLRSHLFRQGKGGRRTQAGRSLRGALTARHLRERQRVYHNGGGGRSSTAAQARRRAAEAVRRKRR